MNLKAALATGKAISLAGVTDGYISGEEVEDMIAGGELSIDSIFSDAWLVETAAKVTFTETDFKTIWNSVAGEFTSVKPFDTSALAKKLLGRIVAGHKVA